MHGAQLTFSPRQGPAIELLRLQGGLWMDDSRVASYAVARWALCCDPQLVKGNVLLVVQCGTLIVQTPKPANLRICKGRDGSGQRIGLYLVTYPASWTSCHTVAPFSFLERTVVQKGLRS